jgi:hypothetical protein
LLTVVLEKSECRPGETLSGRVSGDALASGAPGEIRLIYFTEGKGMRDLAIVASIPTQAGVSGQPFTFNLPKMPWSFRGKLITLAWAVEAVVGKQSARAQFTVSPGGAEIVLEMT